MKSIILWITCLFLVACNSSEKEENLIIGTSADNPPYEFIQDNKITGLDIDIAHAIGEKLKKKVIIKNFEFNGLLAALISKNVDFIIAGLSITPDRAASVDFSQGYLKASVAVLYRAADNFSSMQDLQQKTIGVQIGSIWEKLAQDYACKLHLKTHSLSNNLMLIEELKTKTVDAVMLEEVQSKRFVANNPDFNYFTLQDDNFEFAIAFSKSSALREEVNNVIKLLEEDGTLNNIRQKWLGK